MPSVAPGRVALLSPASGATVTAVVDATNLGGALTATVVASVTVPAVVDATNLGGALTATVAALPTVFAVVDATNLGGALSATVAATPEVFAVVNATNLGGALSATVAASVTAAVSAVVSGSFGDALLATIIATVTEGTPVTTGAITGLGWRGLLEAARRAGQEQQAQRSASLVACPRDGEPLERARGVAHCRFCGDVYAL